MTFNKLKCYINSLSSHHKGPLQQPISSAYPLRVYCFLHFPLVPALAAIYISLFPFPVHDQTAPSSRAKLFKWRYNSRPNRVSVTDKKLQNSNNSIFLDIMLCSPASVNQCFGLDYSLAL